MTLPSRRRAGAPSTASSTFSSSHSPLAVHVAHPSRGGRRADRLALAVLALGARLEVGDAVQQAAHLSSPRRSMIGRSSWSRGTRHSAPPRRNTPAWDRGGRPAPGSRGQRPRAGARRVDARSPRVACAAPSPPPRPRCPRWGSDRPPPIPDRLRDRSLLAAGGVTRAPRRSPCPRLQPAPHSGHSDRLTRQPDVLDGAGRHGRATRRRRPRSPDRPRRSTALRLATVVLADRAMDPASRLRSPALAGGSGGAWRA